MEPSKRTGAIEDWLCALDTESSRQSAKLLRGRTACGDITEDRWFFKRRFPAETCGKLWKNWGNLEISPWKTEFWHDMTCQS
jgi:pyridoxine/pyridoxamine 5'-phosphate oxidase